MICHGYRVVLTNLWLPEMMLAIMAGMLQTAGQWLTQNALWLGGLVAVLGIIEKFWKPFRSITSLCWSRIKRQSKPEAALPSTHLTLIEIPAQCRCVLGKAGNRVMTQIDTHWYVTNATESRMPVQLLKARLLEPRVRHPSVRCYANTARFAGEPVGDVYSPEHKIPWGETRNVSIIILDPPQANHAVAKPRAFEMVAWTSVPNV